jgi:hypothetical protein
MTKIALCGVVAGLGLGLGACGSTYSMTDDIDITWDFGFTTSRLDDNLHTPYVRGAKVTVYAQSNDRDADFSGWSIASSAPGVFRIDDSSVADSNVHELMARGQAVAEGTAELRLLDDRGREIGHALAEVRLPDRVELEAHGSLILGRDDEAQVAEARVVAGGEATYLARYFRGEQELHGNGVLTVESPAGVIAEPRTSFLFENREWLTVRAQAVGTGGLGMVVDGMRVGSVPLAVVPESAIADVVVLTQSETGRSDGEWLVALAQAYDGGGERIFGVDYTWTVNGAAKDGDGDLYRYQFKRGAYEMVEAKRGVHTDGAMIQSDSGYVSSSNNVGCAAGGSGSLAVGLVGLGLVRVRRRRW